MISEVTEWLALHRVHEGNITKFNGAYFTAGRPTVEFLVVALEELIESGLLALGRPDPLGRQQVCVTQQGQTRYAQLYPIAVRTGMVTEGHGPRHPSVQGTGGEGSNGLD